MDILVRKYVEKKANEWGFSNDIDISKKDTNTLNNDIVQMVLKNHEV